MKHNAKGRFETQVRALTPFVHKEVGCRQQRARMVGHDKRVPTTQLACERQARQQV